MKRKYLFIINPEAGFKKANRIWLNLRKKLAKKSIVYSCMITKKQGDGTIFAKEQKNKFDAVIAVGGDGTVSEVVNGLVGSKTPLGIIPAGTGNDFARSIGIPKKPTDALDRILSGRLEKVDLGMADNEYFVNAASLGFDARVVYEAKKEKQFFKTMSYLFSVIKCSINMKTYKGKIKIDGNSIEKEILLIAVANGNYYGGGIMIAPKASLKDGKFDIIIVEKISIFVLLRFLPKVLKGKHLSHPKVSNYKGGNVEIAIESIMAQRDGEIMYKQPKRFLIEKEKLLLII